MGIEGWGEGFNKLEIGLEEGLTMIKVVECSMLREEIRNFDLI